MAISGITNNLLSNGTNISMTIVSPPGPNTTQGVINYVLNYLNGTVFHFGLRNASWYDFVFSPFIFTDWEGWKQYIYDWQNGSIKGFYNAYDFRIYEDNNYFAFIQKRMVKIINTTDYVVTRTTQAEGWYLKSDGSLQYYYYLFIDTYIYLDNQKDNRHVYYTETELIHPGFVNPLKSTTNNKSGFFVNYEFQYLLFPLVLLPLIIKKTKTKNRF